MVEETGIDNNLQSLIGRHLVEVTNLIGQDTKIEIKYIDAKVRAFTILGVEEKQDTLWLTVASNHVGKFLPSLFQNSDFLKRFLWVIQHIQNETSLKLDGLHQYFNPWTAPEEFISWVSGWFNLDIGAVQNEHKRRTLLANAIALYNWRGTVYGMTKLLEAVTEIKPVIYENCFSGNTNLYEGERYADQQILDVEIKGSFFEVHFPVPSEEISQEMQRFIHRIVQNEKPAHTTAFVTYKKVIVLKNPNIISEDSQMSGEEGMRI